VKKKEYKWLKPRFALKHRPKVGLFKRIGWLEKIPEPLEGSNTTILLEKDPGKDSVHRPQ
jgi:hypothetical protein